jgi:hypothetical protein
MLSCGFFGTESGRSSFLRSKKDTCVNEGQGKTDKLNLERSIEKVGILIALSRNIVPAFS